PFRHVVQEVQHPASFPGLLNLDTAVDGALIRTTGEASRNPGPAPSTNQLSDDGDREGLAHGQEPAARARCRAVGSPTSAASSARCLSVAASSSRRRTSIRTAFCRSSEAGRRRPFTILFNLHKPGLIRSTQGNLFTRPDSSPPT